MMENLVYMMMGGISMIMVISLFRNFDLIELCIVSLIIGLSFNLGVLGIVSLIVGVSITIRYSSDEKFLELIEAFNVIPEVKYLVKNSCKNIASMI